MQRDGTRDGRFGPKSQVRRTTTKINDDLRRRRYYLPKFAVIPNVATRYLFWLFFSDLAIFDVAWSNMSDQPLEARSVKWQLVSVLLVLPPVLHWEWL